MKPSALTFPVRVPFVERLGLELHSMGDGRAEVRVDLDESLTNSWEVAHGGVVMTMMDVAMAMAARSVLPESSGVATIEMKTSFMVPAEHELRCIGRVVHATVTMVFCDAELRDGQGRVCATASGTFKVVRGLKPGATTRQAAR